jgi:competence protein ComFC
MKFYRIPIFKKGLKICDNPLQKQLKAQVIKRTFRSAAHAVLNLFYPPLCLHCQTLLPQRNVLLCAMCQEQIPMIDAQDRCRTCFDALYHGKCKRCMHRPVVIHRQMAVCEAMGPANALLNGIHSGRQECLSAAASLMAYRWLELKMPLPDLLIPFPSSFWKKQRSGLDPQRLLTEELGKLFSVPVRSLLKRTFDRDHFLTQGKFRSRVQLLGQKQEILCDRRVLLVALTLDDDLLRSAGYQLKPFFPAQIDALAFAAPFIE